MTMGHGLSAALMYATCHKKLTIRTPDKNSVNANKRLNDATE